MKKIFIFATFLFTFQGIFTQGIAFEENIKFSEALAKAEKENKYIFLDFYTPWCPPCKLMALEVFPQKTVGDYYNAHFVNISLDAEKEENKELASKLLVTSFPNLIFLNSKGDIIHRAMDGMSADDFLELGKTALDFTKNYNAIELKVKNGDRTPEILGKYFEFIPFADEKEILTIDYLNQLSDNEKMSNVAWSFFRDYILNTDSKPFMFFAKNTQLFINQYGEEKIEKKMVNLFRNTYHIDKSFFNSLKKYNQSFYNKVELKLKTKN